MALQWHILTGEYPPALGGVGDYCAQLANALVTAGDRVDVWTTWLPGAPPTSGSAGPCIHRIPEAFGPRGLRDLSNGLVDTSPSNEAILLVQYVPSAFGYRAMNVPFAAWLGSRRQRVWMMFHEVAYPMGLRVPFGHSVRGAVNRGMARLALRRAERSFVSTTAWTEPVKKLWGTRATEIVELPIPSNLSVDDVMARAQQLRQRFVSDGQRLIGHFGTYGAAVAPQVRGVMTSALLRDSSRRALLVGRASETFANDLVSSTPALAGRVFPTGTLSDSEAAAHLAACDVLVQPFADGVTTRRTTLMAALALGKATITNAGHLSEELWQSSGAVQLASTPSVEHLSAALEELLAKPERWPELGAKGQELYRSRFSIDRCVSTLRSLAQ